jgi:hypothetical protein
MRMIFPMARRCAADWQRVCPKRSGFAYFRADFAQTHPAEGIRDPLTTWPHHEIMINDEY